MKVPSRRVVIEYPSGVRRALATSALAVEVERLAGYTAELGLGQLVLSILPPERESTAPPPSSKTVAVPRAARRSRKTPTPTAEPATTIKRRKRRAPVDVDDLDRARQKKGFSPTEYAKRTGITPSSMYRALRRLKPLRK